MEELKDLDTVEQIEIEGGKERDNLWDSIDTAFNRMEAGVVDILIYLKS